MKALINTNVIVDALTSREPWKESAEKIFLMIANQVMDAYINIYYLVRKYLHSTEQAKNTMSKLYELFCILDVTADDCQEALLTDMKDYEDSVISCCAKRNRMEYIVTRNIKDYQNSKVKAMLPDEFIRMAALYE